MMLMLTACAITQPLRDVHYIADGWVIAAYDDKTDIFVHAKELPTINKAINKETGWNKIIVVKAGDTLSSISHDMYGSRVYAGTIAFNNDIDDFNIIHVGEELKIPFMDVVETTIDLKQWEIRYVNSDDVAQCINVNYINIDVSIQIESGWYQLDPLSTLYVGLIVQEFWELENETITLDDAAWAVDTIEVVSFSEKDGCAFTGK